MHPPGCRRVLDDDMQFIAVPQIQCPQTLDLWSRRKAAPHGSSPACNCRFFYWILPAAVTIDPLHDLVERIALSQPVKPEVSFRPLRLDGGVHQLLAALAIELDFIAKLAKHCPKLLLGQGCLDCPVKVCFDDAPSGGLALLLGNKFTVVLALALRVLDDR